jgi:hypothetical protein
MKFILIFSLLTLVSCATQKENVNSSVKFEKIDTLIIKDEILTTNDDSLFQEKREELVEEMKIIKQDDDTKEADLRKQIQLIEKHEKKTQLKVIDKSSSKSVNDTTRGWIAYSVPDEMKVFKTYSIKVRISKKSNVNKATLILGNSDAINNPEYPSIATIEDVKVSGEMVADLRGDVDIFVINSLSTEKQSIDDDGYTEWEWSVTPKKSGDNSLKLVIKLKDLSKDIIVFNKNIKIKSNVPVVVESFFEKYWQWIMTTIIIPIFVYFWNRKKKRKTKKS